MPRAASRGSHLFGTPSAGHSRQSSSSEIGKTDRSNEPAVSRSSPPDSTQRFRHLPPAVLAILEDVYLEHRYLGELTQADRNALLARTGLSPQQCIDWWRNKRCRERNRIKREGRPASAAPSPTARRLASTVASAMPRAGGGADAGATVLRTDSFAVDGFERGRAVVLLDPRAASITVALSQTELIELPCHGGLLSSVTLHVLSDSGQIQLVVDLIPASLRSPDQPSVVVAGVQSPTDVATIVSARRHIITFHDGTEATEALVAHALAVSELGDALIFASTPGSAEPPLRLRELHPTPAKAMPPPAVPPASRRLERTQTWPQAGPSTVPTPSFDAGPSYPSHQPYVPWPHYADASWPSAPSFTPASHDPTPTWTDPHGLGSVVPMPAPSPYEGLYPPPSQPAPFPPLSDDFGSAPSPFDPFSSQSEYQLAPSSFGPSSLAPSYPRLSEIPRYFSPFRRTRAADDPSNLYAAIGAGGSGMVVPEPPMMPGSDGDNALGLGGPFGFDFSLPSDCP